MIVKRNRANVTKIAGTFFFPGNNVINPEDEEKFTNNEIFNSLLSTKIKGQPIHEIVSEGEAIKVISKSSGKEIMSDLAGMNAKNAIATVNDTFDIPTLEKWADVEDRSTVLKAIDSQISSVKDRED